MKSMRAPGDTEYLLVIHTELHLFCEIYTHEFIETVITIIIWMGF
jgi:hypothetical protein